GDTMSVVTGAPAETTTATLDSLAGTYPIMITQGTLAAANYTFTFVNGTLTVQPPLLPGTGVLSLGALPVVTTMAGNGTDGDTNNGGVATSAQFGQVHSVAMDKAGNMYVAESDFDVVRKVTPSGIVSIVAGVVGSAGFSGDGGP